MKRVILIVAVIAATMVSCGPKQASEGNVNNDSVVVDTIDVLEVDSTLEMHSEIK